MYLHNTSHTHNSLSCLIVRTLSALIYLSNSPGVFGHRAILLWGDRGMAGGFLEAQPVTFAYIVTGDGDEESVRMIR